ncbi:MAG: hypothetical protein GF346_10105 [Candidatus Eisenbacteria bacterium]|nr:hypothetical protein [Candidatus Latescibacterota bacterium]MBD3302787.1 hypothetical protein [Candidatus Eisenbacteria bacterium]
MYNDLVSTILGDYIYTKSLVDLIDRGEDRILRAITRTTYQMSIGEMLQIHQKRSPFPSEKDYMELVDAKTASLMSASCEVGALVADLDEDRILLLREFGLELGRAYQITDDIFDYVGDAGQLGKSSRSDLAEGKVTLPLIRALDRSNEAARERMREILERKNVEPDDWKFVIALLDRHGTLDECRASAMEAADRALSKLDRFSASVYLDGLREAVRYAVARSH